MLSAVVGAVYSNLHPECELPYSKDLRDKQGIMKLMVGAWDPYIPIPYTW